MTDNAGTSAKWQRWNDELDLACKAKGFDQWEKRAKKIVERYRASRPDVSDNSDVTEGSRFNILWSNVQTLLPALFAKSPKPVVERRYLDRDDVGRTASVILERTLSYELDDGTYTSALKKVVLDRLLPGRGVAWIRYEPKFTPMPGKTQEVADEARPDAAGGGADDDRNSPSTGVVGDGDGDAGARNRDPVAGADNGPGPGVQEATTDAPQEQVAAESVVVDYIDWKDFRTSPARTWEEVWWVAKRVYMTRPELMARFGKKGRQPVLDWSPVDTSGGISGSQPENSDKKKRAKVWELWNKVDRKVVWFAESWNEDLLDEREDPLGLESFWPVPKPLFATLTNDSLIPVPDYVEYEDQAVELDDLTTRIANLTKAIKVAGVYDASVDELKRMFEEGFENELVPCDNMAEFSSKAGANGMGHIWLLPIKDMAATLIQLYDARDRCKQVLYEVTGISDIVRGQAGQGGAKTATEQRIKGQFASMRLNDMQGEVARFARDVLRIMGEIIAEHFDPMTLFEVSGFEQYAKEQWPPQVQEAPQPPPNPMLGHNGGPPMAPPAPAMGGAPPPLPPPGGAGSPGMGGVASAPPAGLMPPGMPPMGPFGPAAGMMAPPPSPEQVAMQKAAEMFRKAIELLRNDKLRGFRIDIETDSLIEPDQQEMQQARTALMQAISQFLPEAIKAGAQAPELKPLMARLLMFFLRGFKASRDIESAFEQFIDDMTRDAAKPKPPPPPTPEQQKLDIEREKQAGENQRMAAQAQIDQQQAADDRQAAQAKAQQDAALAQQEAGLKLEAMRAENAFKEREYALKEKAMLLDIAAKERTAMIQAASTEHAAGVKAASAEHSAAMKAKQAEKAARAPAGGNA